MGKLSYYSHKVATNTVPIYKNGMSINGADKCFLQASVTETGNET